jgi:small basic protein
VLDSNGLRVLAYTVAAIACLVAGVREAVRKRKQPELWPTFWLVTAAFFLVIAAARETDIADLVTQLGRDVAIVQGWYDHRRKYQAMAVATVTGIWFVTVVISLWRVPARRRRYLPVAVVAFSLLAFSGIRAVSLHQIDAVLYRRPIHGVKIDAIVELTGLLLAIGLTFWPPRRDRRRIRSTPPAPVWPVTSQQAR